MGRRSISTRCVAGRLAAPGAIAARFETGALTRRTRLADPRLPLRARSRWLGLPRPIVWRGAARRFVLPGFSLAWRARSIRWLAGRPIASRRAGGSIAPATAARSAIRRAPGRRPIGLLAPRSIATRRADWLVAPRLRRVARLVAIALRCGILLRPRALGTILLLEPIARILVRAAGAPVAAAPLRRRRPIASRLARRRRRMLLDLKIVALRLARRPQLPSREPLHGDVGVLALQLHEGRLQLLALARAEGGRLVVDQNRPVRVAGRHPFILSCRKTVDGMLGSAGAKSPHA